jgi:hypothetical protein
MPLSDYQLQIGTTGLTLGAGTDYIVHAWGELGLPTLRVSDRTRPFQHGSFFGPEYIDARPIQIDLTIRGDDDEDCMANVDALVEAWYIDARADQDYDVQTTLSVKLPGQDERFLYGRPRRSSIDISRIIAGKATATLEFLASDPRWLGSILNEATLNVAEPASGRGYDRGFDYGYGGGSSNAVTCTNEGNFPTTPTLRLDGPLTNPSVANETTGKSLELTYTLLTGEYLEIDFRDRTILLNGTASRYYTKSGDWWELIAGDNTVRLSTDSGDGNATLSWRDAWL